MSNAAIKKIFPIKVLSQQKIDYVDDIKESDFLFTLIKTIMLLVIITFCCVWIRVETLNIGYEIAKANKERTDLLSDNKRVKLEILNLKTPQRIERIAIDKLGLIYPKGEQIIRIN